MATLFVWAMWTITLWENYALMRCPFTMAGRVIPPFVIMAFYTYILSSATG
jgi:hypothetical protein